MKTNAHLNSLLKEARLKAGLTQNELSSKLGYTSLQYVSNWERNKQGPPLLMLRQICELLSIDKETAIKAHLADRRKEYQILLGGQK